MKDKRNRIKKNDAPYISEAHDNYRRPQPFEANDDELSVIYPPQMRSESPQGQKHNVMYLFNYFDEEEVTQFTKKLFERHEEEMREARNRTMYGETFGKVIKMGKDAMKFTHEGHVDTQMTEESLKKNIMELRKKVDTAMTWTAAGKPRYGDLLKTELELQPKLWQSLGQVSELADKRKH